jgi:hypothetical protein
MTSSLIKEKLLQRGPKQALQSSFVFLRAPRLKIEACASRSRTAGLCKNRGWRRSGLIPRGYGPHSLLLFFRKLGPPITGARRGIPANLSYRRAVRESLVTGNGAPSHHGNTNIRYFYTKLARRRPLIRGREKRRIMVESIRPGDLGSLRQLALSRFPWQ